MNSSLTTLPPLFVYFALKQFQEIAHFKSDVNEPASSILHCNVFTFHILLICGRVPLCTK